MQGKNISCHVQPTYIKHQTLTVKTSTKHSPAILVIEALALNLLRPLKELTVKMKQD